ncbi:EKC/KEOPS complex subunit LAGE3 isoform X2 [Melopsittacus undulatus]|uniref:EKC/KEOPS complex subunit LAGE3 isoform X2 n=1 Tax=Melopsittacus undulatus TaxID=13146 RepID=UPI00146C3D98|nr:EKC/KEOPS complex subunit LAGE3 isoform X2 [Melopsittacus undulatus]
MAADTEGLELLRLPLPSPHVAHVALGSLRPDLNPPHGGGGARAELEREGAELHARWVAPGARGLRGGVTTFLELLGLVLETIERFGGEGPDPAPPLPPQS